MHPASRILTYLLAALAIPGLPFFMLALLFASALPILLRIRRAPLRLFWRTRWLLLVLLLGYAYGLPGEPLLPDAGVFSPSHEGLAHGARQAVSLLVLLLWLDILVLAQPPDRLLGGLYQLTRPLSWIGLERTRVALRLGLTLQAIEGLERGRGNLLRLLSPNALEEAPSRVRIHALPIGAIDVLVPLAILVAMAGRWLNA